jgi:uncharacterized membrane protein YeaQ/YmgE (transglycosylase-associated protein family)
VDDYYASYVSPYVPWIVMAVNGAVVGGLAGLVAARRALIRDVFLGIIGSFIGGSFVQAGVFNIPYLSEPAWVQQVAASSIGAVILVLVARAFTR